MMHIPLGEASNFVARTTQKPLAWDTVQESSFVRCRYSFVLLHGTSRSHWMAGIWNEILRPNADKSYLLWTRNKVYELDLVIGLYFPHVSKPLFPRKSMWQHRKAVYVNFCERLHETQTDHHACWVCMRRSVQIPPRTQGILTLVSVIFLNCSTKLQDYN